MPTPKKPLLAAIILIAAACLCLFACSPAAQETPTPTPTPLASPTLLESPIPTAIAPKDGEVYVSSACVYRNPLSSFAAVGGDSGCRYIVEGDGFTIENRQIGTMERLDGVSWEYAAFTPEEWENWFTGPFAIPGIAEYSETLMLELSPQYRLLSMDGALWLMKHGKDPKMGNYVWEIYSLVRESDMGSAVCNISLVISARFPAFRFAFDMPCESVSAVCVDGGELVGFDDHDGTAYPSGVELRVPAGSALYWMPFGGEEGTALSATIHFTVNGEGDERRAGTIYITGVEKGPGGTYTATVVGGGFFMAQAEDAHDGAVISLRE